MTSYKPAVFPISFFVADDRTGSGNGYRRSDNGAIPARGDFRKLPLREIPLFSGVSEESLRRLDQATRLNIAKGREIISRADQSRDAYVLLSGQARVTFFSAGGKAVAFRRLDPGDLFGEFAAIDGQGRSASVEATKAAAVLHLPQQLFREILESDPAFAGRVMRHLVELLRSLTSRIVEFSTLGVKNRIHCELLRMARKALADAGSAEISPAPTHSDLAARISTHREAVSRELSRLAKIGIIERRGRTIYVKDVPRLERMVNEAVGE